MEASAVGDACLRGQTARTVADQSQIASLGAQVLNQADTIAQLQTNLLAARSEISALETRADHLSDALRGALEAQAIAVEGAVPTIPDRSALELCTVIDTTHEIAALRAAVEDELATRHSCELAMLREELAAREREAIKLRDAVKLHKSETQAMSLTKKELRHALMTSKQQITSLKSLVPPHLTAMLAHFPDIAVNEPTGE